MGGGGERVTVPSEGGFGMEKREGSCGFNLNLRHKRRKKGALAIRGLGSGL